MALPFYFYYERRIDMWTNLICKSRKFLKKNGSTILTCMGVAGVVGTAVMAVKATPKAMELIEDAKKEKGEDLTKLQTIVVAAPAYIPSALIGVGTIACIIGSNVLNKRQQAALTSAYIMLNRSYNDYKAKLVELYGKDADDKIQQELMKEKIEAEPPYIAGNTVFYATRGLEALCDNEKALFYDTISERYFESTPLNVYAAEYHLSRNFILMGCATPNDFYDFLGIPQTPDGDVIGWSMENGYCWLDCDHTKTTMDDGLVCYSITPVFTPETEYDADYHYENI